MKNIDCQIKFKFIHVSFYTTKRVGGILVDSQAVKVLKLSK